MVKDLHEQVHSLKRGELVVCDIDTYREEEASVSPVDHLERLVLQGQRSAQLSKAITET